MADFLLRVKCQLFTIGIYTVKYRNEQNNTLHRIRQCIENGHYTLKLHQKQREQERGITRAEVLYVLKSGNINHKDGSFDSKFQRDKYAIWGRTLDGRELEVIVAFDQEGCLEIITTFDLGEF
jgi:Domain of unknown function (DUF4258)